MRRAAAALGAERPSPADTAPRRVRPQRPPTLKVRVHALSPGLTAVDVRAQGVLIARETVPVWKRGWSSIDVVLTRAGARRLRASAPSGCRRRRARATSSAPRPRRPHDQRPCASATQAHRSNMECLPASGPTGSPQQDDRRARGRPRGRAARSAGADRGRARAGGAGGGRECRRRGAPHAYAPTPRAGDRSQHARRIGPEGDPEAARALTRRGNRVLTMQDDPAFARQALQAGALGFVLKEAAEEELLHAIRSAAAGDTYLNPRLGARIAAQPLTSPGSPDDLSDREIRRVAHGRVGTHQCRDRRATAPISANRRNPARTGAAQAGDQYSRGARALRARPRLAESDLTTSGLTLKVRVTKKLCAAWFRKSKLRRTSSSRIAGSLVTIMASIRRPRV